MMRTLLLASVASTLLAFNANATGICTGNANCSSENNSATATNSVVNVPVNTNVATGGEVKNSGNSFNVNDNDQLNVQKQLQGQGQHQSNRATSSSDSVSSVGNSGNSSVSLNEYHPKQNPGASAPSFIGAGGNGDSCTQMQGGGFSNSVFGLALGITHDEDDCNRRKDARHLWDMGFKDASRERMCQDSDTREAMLIAGTPCNADKPATAALEAPIAIIEPAFVPMAPIPN